MMQYLLMILAIVFISVLVLLDYLRPNKKRLVIRVLASVMVVLGLLLLVLPILPNESFNNGEEIIVLTDGYQQDSVDAFVRKRARKLRQVTMADPQIGQLLQGATAHLFGYGIKDTSANFLTSATLYFHPSPLPTGFSEVTWSKNLVLGQEFSLQASIINARKQPLTIYLKLAQKIVDSVNVSPSDATNIHLTTVPNNLGKGIYQLVLMEGKNELTKEMLPFVVTEPASIAMLVLAETPSFEGKFLKNWMTDHGYMVATKTKISKQVFEQGFSNRKSISLERITPQLLQEFQLVVADESAILSLSEAEKNTLFQQIQQKGLGLVVTCDTLLKKSTIPGSPFLIKPINGIVPFTATLFMKGMDTSWHPSLLSSMVLEKGNDQGSQSLVIDQFGRTQVGLTKWGKGTIIATALNNTHTWMLQGNKEWYANYWTQLVQLAAAKTEQTENWRIGTKIPRVGDLVKINLEKMDTNTTVAIIGAEAIYLKQEVHQPFLMQGDYWPSKTGWHQLVSSNGNGYSWYAFAQEQWASVEANKRMQQTVLFTQKKRLGKMPNSFVNKQEYVKVPVFLALLILWLGLMILWVEGKLE